MPASLCDAGPGDWGDGARRGVEGVETNSRPHPADLWGAPAQTDLTLGPKALALGVDLRCPVHGFLQNTQKLWCYLFPARHSRFDGCLCELSGSSFELMQDFGFYH